MFRSKTDFNRDGSAGNRTQPDGLVHVAIMKFCDDASLYGEMFGETPLFAVHLVCDAAPNPLFMLKSAIAKFCDASDGAENTVPVSYEHFEEEYSVQFAYVGKKTLDTDRVGFKMYRSGFYIGGSMAAVKNLLMLLDDVFKFRLTYEDDRMERLPRLLAFACTSHRSRHSWCKRMKTTRTATSRS